MTVHYISQTEITAEKYISWANNPIGKKAIKKMNNLKIGCDLSHINEKGFYSAIEIADFPLATHSNCYEICPHKRNLKMDQIKLIAETNLFSGDKDLIKDSGVDIVGNDYCTVMFIATIDK